MQGVTIRWYNACAYYAVALARGLEQEGVRVTVAGGGGTPALAKAAEYGMQVLSAPAGGGPTAFARTIATYRSYALREGVDLVNVHHGRDHLLWMTALAGTGIPVVRTYGNQIPPKRHLMARGMYRKSARVIATCRTIHSYFTERLGMEPASVPVINGGVDAALFHPDTVERPPKRPSPFREKSVVFGILARFSPDKGHEIFFEAAGKTARECPEARFLVAGWDAQLTTGDMKAMAKRHGVADRTLFSGREPDTRNLIALADVGVITSIASETICRIAMEYMAMETPVVATDTNVIPEVVADGVSGLVVPKSDSDALAAAMKTLCADAALRKRFGMAGRRRVEERYSLESFARTTLGWYVKSKQPGGKAVENT